MTVPVINGTVTLPAGGIHGIQAGQTLQLGDGTLIKTEAAPAGWDFPLLQIGYIFSANTVALEFRYLNKWGGVSYLFT